MAAKKKTEDSKPAGPDKSITGTTEEAKPRVPPKGSKPGTPTVIKEVLSHGEYGEIKVVEKGDGGKVHSVNVPVYPENPRAESTVAEALLDAAGYWWAEIQMMGWTVIIRNVRELPAPAEKDAGEGKEE